MVTRRPDVDPPGPAPSPRAFAQGVGVLLQTVGVVMFLSTCCVCTMTGLWDPPATRGQVKQLMKQNPGGPDTIPGVFDTPARAGLMLIVVFMTVGGLGLAGFGLGLQSDRRGAAWGAMATALLLVVVMAAAGVCVWVGHASWTVRLWHAVLTAIVLVLCGFCAAALAQVRRHPPPPGLETLPDDFELPRGFH